MEDVPITGVLRTPTWWYMNKVAEALKHRPLGSTASNLLFCAATFGDEKFGTLRIQIAEGVKLMRGFIEWSARELNQALPESSYSSCNCR